MEKPMFNGKITIAYNATKTFEMHRAEREEYRILSERIARLENDPSSAIPWKDIKRSD